MRVAIPIWGDKISPVFDTATRLLIVDVDGSESKRCDSEYGGGRPRTSLRQNEGA